MNRAKPALLCVAISLAVGATHAAETSVRSYNRIPEVNMFRLRAPEPKITPPPPEAPKSQITVQGVNDFGVKQALFKVTPPGSGQKEAFYVLNEGQRQDGIEVLAIDLKRGSVTFKIGNDLQVVVMERYAPKTLASDSPPSVSRLGHRTSGITPPPIRETAAGNPPSMTLEEQTVLIEIERERTKEAVAAGDLPPLPPTDLTPGLPGQDGN